MLTNRFVCGIMCIQTDYVILLCVKGRIKEVIFMTAKETEILASIIQIIQSMSAQSRRDLLLMGRGILLGEQNRKRDDHAEKS